MNGYLDDKLDRLILDVVVQAFRDARNGQQLWREPQRWVRDNAILWLHAMGYDRIDQKDIEDVLARKHLRTE